MPSISQSIWKRQLSVGKNYERCMGFYEKFTWHYHFLWYYTTINTETCLNPENDMEEIVCTTKERLYEQHYVLPWGILQQYNPLMLGIYSRTAQWLSKIDWKVLQSFKNRQISVTVHHKRKRLWTEPCDFVRSLN